MLKNRSEFARMAGVTASSVTQACKGSLAEACSGKRIDASHPSAIKYLESHARGKMPEPAPGVDPLYADAVEFCLKQEKPTARRLRKEFSIGQVRADKIFATIKATGALEKFTAKDHEHEPVSIPKKRTKPISGHTARNHTKKAESLGSLVEGKTLHKVPENIEAFADMTLRELIERFGTDTAFCDWLKATKSIEDINEKRIKSAQLRGELISRDLVKIGIIDPIDSAHKKLLTDVKKTVATRVMAMVAAGKTNDEVEAFVADQITSILRPTKAKIARTIRNA